MNSMLLMFFLGRTTECSQNPGLANQASVTPQDPLVWNSHSEKACIEPLEPLWQLCAPLLVDVSIPTLRCGGLQPAVAGLANEAAGSGCYSKLEEVTWAYRIVCYGERLEVVHPLQKT